MRYLFGVIVICGLVIWLAVPKVTPMPKVMTMGPNPQLRTFNQTMDDRTTLQNAADAGKLHENPERRTLRQAVIRAAGRVESSPCDLKQRQVLRETFDTYVKQLAKTRDMALETYTLKDGTVIDASHHFQEAVDEALQNAQSARCGED
jgi:hypothetical protein